MSMVHDIEFCCLNVHFFSLRQYFFLTINVGSSNRDITSVAIHAFFHLEQKPESQIALEHRRGKPVAVTCISGNHILYRNRENVQNIHITLMVILIVLIDQVSNLDPNLYLLLGQEILRLPKLGQERLRPPIQKPYQINVYKARKRLSIM